MGIMDTSNKNNKCYFTNGKDCHIKKRNAKNKMCFMALATSLKKSKAIKYIKEVLKERQIKLYIAAENSNPGSDVWCEKICSKIIQAELCIVFLNEEKGKIANPNVYYEYGFMSALRKNIIPIQSDKQKLRFDIANRDTIKYKYGNDLKQKINENIDYFINGVIKTPHHFQRDKEVKEASLGHYVNKAYKNKNKQTLKIELAVEYGNPIEILQSNKLKDFEGIVKNCLLMKLRLYNTSKYPLVLKQLMLQIGNSSSNVYLPNQSNTSIFKGQYYYPVMKEGKNYDLLIDRDRYFSPDMSITQHDTKIITSLFLIRQDDIIEKGHFNFKIVALDANNRVHVGKFKYS